MHASGGAERPGGWVVKLRRGRRNLSVGGAAGHQHLAVLEGRGREGEATDTHVPGKIPRAIRPSPPITSRERQCGNDECEREFVERALSLPCVVCIVSERR